jgi:hypothetical protein
MALGILDCVLHFCPCGHIASLGSLLRNNVIGFQAESWGQLDNLGSSHHKTLFGQGLAM